MLVSSDIEAWTALQGGVAVVGTDVLEAISTDNSTYQRQRAKSRLLTRNCVVFQHLEKVALPARCYGSPEGL